MVGSALSPTLQTLFADLVQQISHAPVAATIYTRQRDGIEYYYAKIPVAGGRIDSFVGRVGDPVAEAQVAQMRLGMEQGRARRKTISILKAAGLAGPDRFLGGLIDALAHAGLFQSGTVLVGPGAYMLYEPHVGHRLPAPTLMTGDLDLAIVNLALAAQPPEPMLAILRRADPSFEPVPQLDPRRPASRFRNARHYYVNLVTQARTQDDTNPVPLTDLDAGAAPLQHMRWLVEAPLATIALWGSGVPVTIPQPARFAVHKLILAQKRTHDRIKRSKDLDQAAALMEALAVHDPYALEDALADARAQGVEGWARPLDRSLTELAARS